MSSEGDKLAKQALQAYEEKAFEDAVLMFERAKDEYAAAGQPLQSAEMANNLSVALGQVDRFQAALEVLEGTLEVFLQHGDMTKAAQSIGNEAAAYEGLGEWEKAELLYQQAAERFAQIGDKDSQHFTLQALSRVRLRQGRAMEAVSTMQAALETGSKRSWRSRLVRKILDLPSRLIKP